MKLENTVYALECPVSSSCSYPNYLCLYPAAFIAKKLCPELVLVPIHFEKYTERSSVIMTILRRYDPGMYAAGCDEAYLK